VFRFSGKIIKFIYSLPPGPWWYNDEQVDREASAQSALIKAASTV